MAAPTAKEMYELFKKLKALSPSAADAYKSVAPDGVTGKEISQILSVLLDKGGDRGELISSDEAETLVKLLDSGMLDADALNKLKDWVNRDQLIALFNGASTVLDKSDKQLSALYDALSLKNTGKIKFTSPGTGFTYGPTQYQAIVEIVKSGEIKVVLVDDRGLLKKTLVQTERITP